uniref:Serine aminopeptidase S33 domain-containing protein n=1 Tax=Zea mays TaxID=4577 RepID=A0A804QPK0_MAIZE
MMDVEYHEEYVRNARGVQLFTCVWLPAPSSAPTKALVFLCHGYGMECSDFMRACGMKLATAGYGVFGIDYEGHGKSMGARCYIHKFESLVADCDMFFKSICDMEGYRNKSRFLYGESMGGAVALLLHRKDPTFWDGAVLVAPMCKISEKVKPHPVVVTLLTQVEEIIPKWKIVPTKDVIDSAFKDPVKREKEEHAHLPGQAPAEDGAGASQDQHGCGRQSVRGIASQYICSSCFSTVERQRNSCCSTSTSSFLTCFRFHR